MRVLIVDDEPLVRRSLEKVFLKAAEWWPHEMARAQENGRSIFFGGGGPTIIPK